MRSFPCHYLKGEVELSDEREAHIADSHPDLLPEFLLQVGLTLAAPDEVRRSLRLSSARIFCRQFEEVRHGKGLCKNNFPILDFFSPVFVGLKSD